MEAETWRRKFEGEVVEGKYHLVKFLGAGGFGGVFLADHVVNDRFLRKVAVKLMFQEPGNIERQMGELQIAIALRHKGLLECYDVGACRLKDEDMLYLVMEVADESLDNRMGGRISAGDTRNIMVDVAAGLAYLHDLPEHYVHRDVKPSNILRVGDCWKLSDFGLTRGVGSKTHDQTSNILGTPAYAAPEMYDGVVSPAQDVWALGVIMAEMLTGSHPFPAETSAERMKQVLLSNPRFPSPLPPPFDLLAEACFRKERGERITAAELARGLAHNASSAGYPTDSRSSPPRVILNTKIIKDLEFVHVPEGEFLYGEKKLRVRLEEFWIMKCPVTVREYRRFCKATNREMPETPEWGWIDNHPMVNVSWYNASAFATWAGGTLPMEQQWEKAARGTDGRKYPWGNTFNAAKCVCSVGIRRSSTAPVGSCPAGASPYGCLDMAGNVWEWCEDRYDSDYDFRVLRGGSWNRKFTIYFRASYRNWSGPGSASYFRGFRVVLQGSG